MAFAGVVGGVDAKGRAGVSALATGGFAEAGFVSCAGRAGADRRRIRLT